MAQQSNFGSASHEELARNALSNGEEVKKAIVYADPTSKATPLFFLVLDFDWAESTVATGMYEHDAVGIAHAICRCDRL